MLRRCFVASFVPPEAAAYLSQIQQQWQETLSKEGIEVRWTKPSQIHLTWHFLGLLNDKQINQISKQLKENITKNEQINWKKMQKIELVGSHVFPTWKNPRLLSASFSSSNRKHLKKGISVIGSELQKQVSEDPFSGPPIEKKKEIKPHMTIGRLNQIYVPSLLTSHSFRNMASAPFSIDISFPLSHLSLVQSTLTPSGPVYDVIDQVELFPSDEQD